MSNFALVTFLEKSTGTIPEGKPEPEMNFMGRLIRLIKTVFSKPRAEGEKAHEAIEADVKKIELYDDTSVYLIKLLCSAEEAALKISKINEVINNLTIENDIKNVFLSKELCGTIKAGWISDPAINGHLLYRSLLIEILEGICVNKGIKIGDLDITIIHGKSSGELFSVISLLSPITRYMTVITDRKDDLENEINRIYNETGLSVGLSTDSKASLKDAGVIINLGDPACINNSKLNTKALIINYNTSASKNISKENVVVNGVELNFPVRLLQRLDKEMLKSFNRNNLAGIMLCHKLGYTDKAKSENEYEFLKGIALEFKKDGYKITGLRGRHDSISFEKVC